MFMDGRESRVGHVPGLVRFTIEMAAMAAQYVDSHNYNGSLMVAHLFMLNKKQSARAQRYYPIRKVFQLTKNFAPTINMQT